MWPVTRVKICGITRAEDARRAVELGAWAIGLVFAADSPRRCDPAEASAIGSELRRRVEVAGVFVNEPLDELTELADACELTILQLHGDEGPSYCEEAKRRTGLKIMKAARVRDAGSVRAVEAYRRADFHLLDAWVPGLMGGTGQSFDWELARAHRGPVPLVLSGGLDPANVEGAIAGVRPFAVDTASGTEASPGVKDPALVEGFFEAVERADSAAAA